MGVKNRQSLSSWWNIASSYPPFLPESLLHCLPAFQQIRYFQIVPLIFIFSLSCQCHPVEQKRTAYTGNTHDPEQWPALA